MIPCTYYSGTKYVSTSSQSIGASATATTNYAYSWNTTNVSQTLQTTSPGSVGVSYTEYNGLGLPWRTWGTGGA